MEQDDFTTVLRNFIIREESPLFRQHQAGTSSIMNWRMSGRGNPG
jgi:hypothetical protein